MQRWVKVAGRGLTTITSRVLVVGRLMCVLGCVRRRRRVGCLIVLLLLVVAAARAGWGRMDRRVTRVVVAVRWLTVMVRKVSINKVRTLGLLAVVVAGLRGLVERRGHIIIQTQIPVVVGVMPVRLVRAVLVGVVRTWGVLVVAVVTVGMAAVVVALRNMVAVVVAADLVM